MDMLGALGQASGDLDDVGADLPAKELKPLDVGEGGILDALERGDQAVFTKIARRLGRDWWCALDWGAAPAAGGWARLRDEGERAWPFMTPGRIIKGDGTVVDGVSPSGAPRGDRFVLTSDAQLDGPDEPFGACREVAAKLKALGEALSDSLAAEPRLQMTVTRNTEALFACFPGRGAKYNVHYDGGNGDPRKLTAILYVNEDWDVAHDGRLMLYDSGGFSLSAPGAGRERCWRCVYPRAGRLVLFRSDQVLHKVNPTWGTRYAITMFFAASTKRELKEKEKKERQGGAGGLGALATCLATGSTSNVL